MQNLPEGKDLEIIQEKARELILECQNDPHMALAVTFAASNMSAAACADDPSNPRRSLKKHFEWYERHTLEVFKRFVKNMRGKGAMFDA